MRLFCVATAALNGGGGSRLRSAQPGQQAPRVGGVVAILDGVFPVDAGHRLRFAQCAVDVHLAGMY